MVNTLSNKVFIRTRKKSYSLTNRSSIEKLSIRLFYIFFLSQKFTILNYNSNAVKNIGTVITIFVLKLEKLNNTSCNKESVKCWYYISTIHEEFKNFVICDKYQERPKRFPPFFISPINIYASIFSNAIFFHKFITIAIYKFGK